MSLGAMHACSSPASLQMLPSSNVDLEGLQVRQGTKLTSALCCLDLPGEIHMARDAWTSHVTPGPHEKEGRREVCLG